MAIGIWGMVIGASTAGGPIVGGLLVEHVSWQSVFFINVPVGVIALVFGLVILKDHRAANAPRSFDILGIALLSGAMFSLIWGIIKAGESWGWGDGRTWAWLGLAILLFVAFGLWQNKVKEPLVPLGMFRSVPLTAGVVLMMLMAFAFMGGLFFVTFFLQGVHGLSPVDSGLHLLPLTAMMIVSSPVAGLLITKFGPRVPLVGGMVCTATAMFGMTTLSDSTGTFAMSLWFALLGCGLAPVMVGATEVIVGNAPMELSGVVEAVSSRPPCRSVAPSAPPSSERSCPPRSAPSSRTTGRARACPAHPTRSWRRPPSSAWSRPRRLAKAPGMTPDVIDRIGGVIHDTFMSGMGLAFTVAGIVAVIAALVATLTKRGANAEAGAGVGHI